MSITVAEALRIGAFRQCKLLAGASGINNVVRFVDSMEVPDITPWLKSNELLVTTGYSIRDDHDALVRLIENLKQVDAAGLAIKPRFMGSIPDDIIQLADELGLPLIEIPGEVPFIQITHPLMKAIANRQTSSLEFSETVHKALTMVELEGNGCEDIAKTLHALIGNAILITDRHLRVLTMAGPVSISDLPLESTDEGSGTERRLRMGRGKLAGMLRAYGTETVRIDGCPWDFWYRPARAKERVYGFVFAIEQEKAPKDLELIALEHATTTATLEFLKQELIREQLKMVEYDFFTELLLGNITDQQEAHQRTKMLGWPQPPWSLVVMDVDDFSSYIADLGESAIRRIKDQIRDIIVDETGDEKTIFALMGKSDSFIFLFSAKAMKGRRRMDESIEAAIARLLKETNLSMSVGISGQIDDVMEIPEGHKEAQLALKITRLVRGAGSIGHYDQLSLERALLDLSGSGALRQYHEETLGKVVEYDSANNGQLIKTIEALVNSAGNRSQASKALYIHRNTLAYRIKQIRKLSGLNLSNPADLVTVAMLLKVRPFI